jgi:hypothetical protein
VYFAKNSPTLLGEAEEQGIIKNFVLKKTREISMKIFNSSTKKLWLPVVLDAGVVGMIQSAYAEGTG